jgi:hypothetical protein
VPFIQEKLLIDLGLAPAGFKLDDISNIIWCTFDVQGRQHRTHITFLLLSTVDATLHTAMDKYEIFAITVSLNTGKKILRFLNYDLELRQSAIDKTGSLIPRIFHVSRIPSLPSTNVLHVRSSISNWPNFNW